LLGTGNAAKNFDKKTHNHTQKILLPRYITEQKCNFFLKHEKIGTQYMRGCNRKEQLHDNKAHCGNQRFYSVGPKSAMFFSGYSKKVQLSGRKSIKICFWFPSNFAKISVP